ncbi:MAG: peptide deformylase [Jatrophihabitans sp.]|uniref:peptide deformylase n=1 Tax=Jatrophihabitans sp. TaxID=1932789 RepID=UPI003F81CBE4
MTIQPIRLFGDPVLRTPAEVVTDFDKQLHKLVADLGETMLDAPGAGLAAPQIGVGLRVFVYWDPAADAVAHLVNPVLHFPSDDEEDGDEGCLSIPGLTFDCRRKSHVVAHGQNQYGDPVTVQGEARVARAIQHETDHLDGVLFVDRLTPEVRREAMRAIREAPWGDRANPTIKVSPHAGRF